jgi:hypothetical protein
MGVTALDLGLRGAAAGLFLMMVVVVVARARPLDAIKWLSVAMAIGGAAYAIVTAPFVPKAALWWVLPILAANPVIFWLWARATFDDDFTVRRWHGALWLVIVGIWFSVFLTWTTWPMLAKAGVRSMSVVALVLSFSAAVQTIRTWSADLVAGRRRLRVAVLILSLLFIALLSGSDLTSISAASLGISRSRPGRRRNQCGRSRGWRGSDRTACRWRSRCRRSAFVAPPRPSDDRGADLPAGRRHHRHAGGQARPDGISIAAGHQ